MTSLHKIIFVFLLTFIIAATYAQEKISASDKLKFAEKLYNSEQYDSAIVAYNGIITRGLEAPELYYNLANCYYKSGHLALAIVNYERAKLLAPEDADIKFNLELARNRTVDKIETLPTFFLREWTRNLSNSVSSNTWAVASIILFVLFLFFTSVFLFYKNIRVRKLTLLLSILLLFACCSSVLFAYQQKQKIVIHDMAIIISSSVTVKSSPDESGTDIFPLHEGTKVNLTDSLGNWREIKLSDGKVGWIKTKMLEVI